MQAAPEPCQKRPASRLAPGARKQDSAGLQPAEDEFYFDAFPHSADALAPSAVTPATGSARYSSSALAADAASTPISKIKSPAMPATRSITLCAAVPPTPLSSTA